ncbi:PilZ domain-containing protein [Magnetococcales bacterium HHB-1]
MGEHISIEDVDCDYEQLVTDSVTICQLLGYVLLEETRIEVRFGHNVQIYIAHLVDHPPELETREDKYGKVTQVEPAYVPFSYIQKQSHLLLEPLSPAKGNIILRKHPNVKLNLLFYNGRQRIETKLSFEEAIQVRGETYLKCSFPSWLALSSGRQFFRVPIWHYKKLPLSILSDKFPRTQATVFDVSIGGMSFCHPIEQDKIPNDSRIQLVFGLPDKPVMKVTGWVRHHGPVTKTLAKTRHCRISHLMTGVQFELVNQKMENKVGNLVGVLQAEYLANINQRAEPLDIPKYVIFMDEKPGDLVHLRKMRESQLKFREEEEKEKTETSEVALSDFFEDDLPVEEEGSYKYVPIEERYARLQFQEESKSEIPSNKQTEASSEPVLEKEKSPTKKEKAPITVDAPRLSFHSDEEMAALRKQRKEEVLHRQQKEKALKEEQTQRKKKSWLQKLVPGVSRKKKKSGLTFVEEKDAAKNRYAIMDDDPKGRAVGKKRPLRVKMEDKPKKSTSRKPERRSSSAGGFEELEVLRHKMRVNKMIDKK